ncbi:FAD-binding protein [Sphingomonadaceae bacterium jetA1]|jgi:3-oxo-5alpha-steroid 4-dehydrogenase|uniref:FAD-binding protein n=1 Tax=Facivitalis istanbulensis TaxID=3075838 RepID=UPI00347FC00D
MAKAPAFSNDTPVEQPLRVRSANDVRWDDMADVVVVGFGGAGAVAAITARERGADVLVVDRFAGGGATKWSGGVTYAGATRHQQAAGIHDDANNMYAYLSQEKMSVRPETLRRFCEESAGQIEWMEAQGVRYDSTLFEHKTTYPPEGSYLYYSGNEKVPSYAANARPAARGHRAFGAGFTGYAHYAALKESAIAKGVRVLAHAPARRLVVDESDSVIGIEVLAIPPKLHEAHEALNACVSPMRPMGGARAEKAIKAARAFEDQITTRKLIRARSGVVLAAGGFIYNLAKLQQQRPTYARAYRTVMRLGSMGCDGSGIDLGRSVGGNTDYLDNFFVARSIAPPPALLHGIIINAEGKRFINEDAYTAFLGEAIGDQTGGKAWLILDHDAYRLARKQALFPGKGLRLYTMPTLLNMLFGGARKARTMATLARRIGVDPAALQREVQAADLGAQRGSDPGGKAPENVARIARGPFHAINMDLDNRFTVTMMFSLGGLTVDEETGEVTRSDGHAIRGLYAAGRTAVGLMSAADVSGMALADTIFSGRRAGRHVAARSNAMSADAAA